jgi:hypothetical protein
LAIPLRMIRASMERAAQFCRRDRIRAELAMFVGERSFLPALRLTSANARLVCILIAKRILHEIRVPSAAPQFQSLKRNAGEWMRMW